MLQENVVTRGAGDVLIDNVLIKGRGNTTWGMPKKPDRLKFDKKQSLMGEPKDKSWVLLSNYADKTCYVYILLSIWETLVTWITRLNHILQS